MADGNPSRVKFTVRHSNLLSPDDYLRFIHLDGFTADWKDLNLSDDDLSILQIQIMLGSQSAPVIAGTGGVRKLRFAPPSWKKGKSGAVRVLYSVFPDYSVAVLAAAYSKGDREDITTQEKKLLRSIIGEIGRILESGKGTDTGSSR